MAPPSSVRTGAGVVGWLLTYWYAASLLGPFATSCTMASDDAWLAVWILGVPAVVLALPLLVLGLRGSRSLRWLTLPHLFTGLVIAPALARELVHATVRGRHLCDQHILPQSYGVAAPDWHAWYAPVQLLLIVALAVLAVLYWRRTVVRHDSLVAAAV